MFVACIFAPGYARAQSAWQSEFKRAHGAAKKEGKVVVGIPPQRGIEEKSSESGFKAKFGFELEVFPASSG